MRTGGCRTILARMQLQIVIEELDPPRGHGVVEGRDAWTFTGWMELIEKVEQLKEEEASTRPGPESTGAP